MNQNLISIGKNKVAFKNIFDMYYKSLCLFAQNYSMDMEQAEDIVQDIFVSVFEKKTNFSNQQSLKVYLYQAVKNNAINIIRKAKVDKKYKDWSKNKPTDESSFYHSMIEEESYRILFKAIDKLPPRSKEVLLLNLEGLKNQDIADHLDLSINTIRTHKANALKLLKEDLKHLSPFIFALLMNLPE
jgi:RNA polymerase sigma-70 factor (ECF subfamily)